MDKAGGERIAGSAWTDQLGPVLVQAVYHANTPLFRSNYISSDPDYNCSIAPALAVLVGL